VQTPEQQKAIVQRMIDAGETEQNIATVIQHFKQTAPPPSTVGAGATLRDRVEAAAKSGNPKDVMALKLINDWEAGQQRMNDNAPMIGAAAAAAMTGGAAIPAILAAGAGGAVGQLGKDSQWSMPVSQRVENALKSGLGGALTQGVGQGIAAVSPVLAKAGRSLWNRAAKVTEPIAKSTQTMRAGGTLMDAKNEIADTVLSQGRGTLTKGNLDALKASLDDMDDAIDSVISGSTKMVSRQELRNALQAKSASVGTGSLAQEAQQNALEKAFELLKNKPPKMTVQDAQKFKRSIYQAYEKTFAAGASDQAIAMADKTTAKALRGAIAREEPAVAEINAQMSKQIPAVKAVEKAISRGGNRDFIGLSQMLAGVVTNPLTVAGALVNHPTIGSFTAQQLYRAAQMLPKDGRTVANILRAAKAVLGGS
jgi:hypothetical protein